MDPQSAAWCELHLKKIGEALDQLEARFGELSEALDDFLDGGNEGVR